MDWLGSEQRPGSVQQANRIDAQRLCANGFNAIDERPVFDQHAQHIRRCDGLFLVSKRQVGAGKLLWQSIDVGFYRQYLAAELGDVLCDFDGWALAQVINIRFEGETKTGDFHIGDGFAGVGGQHIGDFRFDFFHHPFRLVVVHLPSRADETRFLRCAGDDKPGIHRDAVAADAGPRLENVHPGMVIGQLDELPHIDIELVADHGKLVGKGDIHIAVAVFGELAHLGGAGVGDDALAFNKYFVERTGHIASFLGHSADDAIIGHQFAHHMPGQDALGAVGHLHIRLFPSLLGECEIRADLSEPGGQLLGGADGRSGFENHEVSSGKNGGDGFCGGLDVAQVGLVAILERSGHGDEEGIGGLWRGGGSKVTLMHGGMHEHVQLGFDNVNLALVDGIDGALVHIDADDFFLSRGEESGGGQADIAEADHADLLVHSAMVVRPVRMISQMRRAAWPSP